jgi:hypothetical protein
MFPQLAMGEVKAVIINKVIIRILLLIVFLVTTGQDLAIPGTVLQMIIKATKVKDHNFKIAGNLSIDILQEEEGKTEILTLEGQDLLIIPLMKNIQNIK